MTEYAIDKKIPFPPSARYRNRFPFGEMEVGDSFSVGEDELMQARTAAGWYGKRNSKKFSVRKYNDGHRCWRVK